MVKYHKIQLLIPILLSLIKTKRADARILSVTVYCSCLRSWLLVRLGIPLLPLSISSLSPFSLLSLLHLLAPIHDIWPCHKLCLKCFSLDNQVFTLSLYFLSPPIPGLIFPLHHLLLSGTLLLCSFVSPIKLGLKQKQEILNILFLLYPWNLGQYAPHSRNSINICWISSLMMEILILWLFITQRKARRNMKWF